MKMENFQDKLRDQSMTKTGGVLSFGEWGTMRVTLPATIGALLSCTAALGVLPTLPMGEVTVSPSKSKDLVLRTLVITATSAPLK